MGHPDPSHPIDVGHQSKLVETSIPEQKVVDNKPFPLVLTAGSKWKSPNASPTKEQFLEFLRANQEELNALMLQYGAVLFRGLPIDDAIAFDEFGQALGIKNMPYVGGNAVRKKIVADRVFTTNESPPDRLIPFHHEMAQTPNWPRQILFYCEIPAETGGETPIASSYAVHDALREKYPEEMKKLEEKGVVYGRIMTDYDRAESAIGRGWKATFNVETKEQLQEALKARNERAEFLDSGKIRHLSSVLPAIREHNGRKVFFNQLIAAYTGWQDEFNKPEDCVTFGDGSKLNPEFMKYAGEVMEKYKVAYKWQHGDAIFIDNIGAMHSRNTFAGQRRILASLAT
mmetsp:Transcript_22079/g.38142  ORF Transcript_22079/g.38142 Transcript_22079/m.38142 type:complete len:343 (-) Transcript_22079:1298-2326(-)|eukprot:CAMPEP_0184695890 /NCGR_PEP_ID=MMETSP0313-20130426/3365_1 /TAXON_ID=2792 /ORGANISM="Porphyridium aerugineum, Strain SAG 1380-2" /LENGTH=342 /DNA_ID=CAMNT_0027154417 /DNA_START=252 /DNA_END=1280 /DNA_ORIENTATION=-